MLRSSPIWSLLGASAAAICLLAGVDAAQARSSEAAETSDTRPSNDLRLATVGYRLARANADLCTNPQMMSGLLIHDIASYAERDRAKITAHYKLEMGFGVRDLVPESAAYLSGFQRGDEIITVDGFPMNAFALEQIGRSASYDRVEHFNFFLSEALADGLVDVDVKRAGETISLHLVGEPGCGGQVTVMPDRALNAWTDGRFVAVTTRMMELATTDDQLAFVVAHEMSHNILDHTGPSEPTRTIFTASRKGGAGVTSSASNSKNLEIAADEHAVSMLLRAGYDIDGATVFLKKAGRVRWYDIPIGHPGIGRRIKNVTLAAAKYVEERRQSAHPYEMALVSAEIGSSEPRASASGLPSVLSQPDEGVIWSKPYVDRVGGEIRIADFKLGTTVGILAASQRSKTLSNPVPPEFAISSLKDTDLQSALLNPEVINGLLTAVTTWNPSAVYVNQVALHDGNSAPQV
jgi:hypothetical protein